MFNFMLISLQDNCFLVSSPELYLRANDDIKELVESGLPDRMQKALDSDRVIGNNDVQPGVIDINDDPEVAHKLFGFLNIIVDMMITQPMKIEEFYELKIPEKDKKNIAKRDGKTT